MRAPVQPDPVPDRSAADRAAASRSIVLPVTIAGIAAALVLFVFSGILSFSAGLLVIALFVGRIVGLAARSATVDAATRTAVAVSAAVIAVTAGLLGAWAMSRVSGGVLAPLDYLLATLGPVFPLQYLLAVPVAWWSAR